VLKRAAVGDAMPEVNRRLGAWRLHVLHFDLTSGPGTHRLRHVYGRDVSRAIAGLLGQPRTFGQAYNLCQDEMPTLAELVERLAGLLGARAGHRAARLEALQAVPAWAAVAASWPPGQQQRRAALESR